jgi:hypothetical protein
LKFSFYLLRKKSRIVKKGWCKTAVDLEKKIGFFTCHIRDIGSVLNMTYEVTPYVLLFPEAPSPQGLT